MGRYTEFIGTSTGTIFVATKRDHEFLLNQRSDTPNVSSNSNNFRQSNVNEKCSKITQIAPANTGDTSYHMYHTWKQDANAEYLGRVKMALNSCVGGINFVDPANIRKAPEKLMTQVCTEAIHVSNKYNIQIEPIEFEWDKFLPTLEKGFPGILNEVLGNNSQHQQLLPNSNKN